MTRLLQVGCGPTGTSFARQLLSKWRAMGRAIRYTIVDTSPPGFGTGFGSKFEWHLLNVRASAMSLDPNDPLEFVRWRAQQRASWAAHFEDIVAAEADY